jgi:hypothetical protein
MMLTTDYILLRRMKMKIDLIPGPPHDDQTLYSNAIQVIARYPAFAVAGAISKLSGTEVVTDGSRDPRAWQWVWRAGDRSIRIGFSILGKEVDANTAWGGSTLEVDCYVGDLISLWAQQRKTHTDTWLHYDGRVYTATGFIDKLRQMLEDEVITDIV